MSDSSVLAVHISGIIIGAICIIGNALVCHIIVRLKSMKTSMNYIILNLAILDAMTGFFGIFFVIANDNRGVLGPPVLQQAYNQSNTLAEVLCRFQYAYWFGGAVSPLLLTSMAFERYKAIVHPLSALGGGTKARLKWILLISWLSGFSVYFVELITVHFDSKVGICTSESHDHHVWFNRKVYFIVYAIAMYLIPSIAMITFYSRAIIALKRPDQVLSSQLEARRNQHKARERVLKVAILVTCMFYIFCGIPYTAFGLNEFFGFLDYLRYDLVLGVTIIALTFNSAINPFLYFTLIKSFRNGFRRVFINCQRERMRSTFSEISLSRRSVSFERSDTIKSSLGQPKLVAVQVTEERFDFKA